MVDLVYKTGRKADLVAVGGVACRGGLAQLALRQLVFERFREGNGRVARAGHAHRLIDVGAAGERVADGAAEAGRRAAERFDLGRVVVGLVLEHEQPVLVVTVYECLYLDGAGVDLLGLVDVLKVAALLEYLGRDGTHVHQRDRTLCGLFFAVDLDTCRHVAVEGVLNHLILELYVVDLGEEGGVAAVVGPVGIDHAHLSDGGVALFGVAEVSLEELEVVQIHRKPHVMQHLGEGSLIHVRKADNGSDSRRDRVLDLQGRGLVHGRLTGVHGVDEVAADLVHILGGQCAFEDVDLGCCDGRAFAAGEQLNALCAGVRTLVELTGQRLDREYGMRTLRTGEVLIIADIRHRLGEYDALGLFIGFLRQTLGIVAAEIPYVRQVLDLQQIVQAGEQAARFDIEAGFLFGITTINAHFIVSSPLCCKIILFYLFLRNKSIAKGYKN